MMVTPMYNKRWTCVVMTEPMYDQFRLGAMTV